MATAIYKVNYQGLRKRESYDEIIDYLENKQERIKYPNRLAKQIRNSPQLSNLLDNGGEGIVQMEEQQSNAMKEEQKEHAIRQAGGTAQVLRALDHVQQPQFFNIADSPNDSDFDDFSDAVSDITDTIKERRTQKLSALRDRVAKELDNQRNEISDITEESLSMIPKGGLSAGVAENTISGVADVVSGGAKLAIAGGKAVFKGADLARGLVQPPKFKEHRMFGINTFVRDAITTGGSSSSSSSSSSRDRLAIHDRNQIPPWRLMPPNETLAEEVRRRTKAGEKADNLLNEFLKREGKKPAY